MTTFDRYIIRRLLLGFVTLVALLIVFFIALHYVEYMDDFFDRGATMREVFLIYYPSYIPEIVKLTSPLALFLSSIFITSRLAQELQLAALTTSGVSLYRLLVPYALVGIVVTSGMWWFNGWVVPKANQTRIDYEYRYFKDERSRLKTTDIHLQNSPSSILAAEYFDRRTDTAHLVSLQSFDGPNRIRQRIDAREMRWADSTHVWRLIEATRRRFSPDGKERREFVMELDTVLNVLPRDLRRRERDVEFLTVSEASSFVDALKRSGVGDIGRPMVEYYSKFAYPFANLILILISLPLAAVRRQGGQAVQLGIGLGIAFVYLALQKLSEPFGYAGDISPLVATLLPHVVFAIACCVLLYRVRT
ncbi:MAG: LptF/LptG family permease [Rhodothermales bacterium]